MLNLYQTTNEYLLIRTKELYKNDEDEDMVFIHVQLVEVLYQALGDSYRKKMTPVFSTFRRFSNKDEPFYSRNLPVGTFGIALTKDEFDECYQRSQEDELYLFRYKPQHFHRKP